MDKKTAVTTFKTKYYKIKSVRRELPPRIGNVEVLPIVKNKTKTHTVRSWKQSRDISPTNAMRGRPTGQRRRGKGV